jgi:hypothetical protein
MICGQIFQFSLPEIQWGVVVHDTQGVDHIEVGAITNKLFDA